MARSHLSDEEILLFLDRELPSHRHLRAGTHLAECRLCGNRRMELEGTLAEFSQIHEDEADSLDATLSRSRSLLKARMAAGHRGWLSPLRQAGSLSWQLA